MKLIYNLIGFSLIFLGVSKSIHAQTFHSIIIINQDSYETELRENYKALISLTNSIASTTKMRIEPHHYFNSTKPIKLDEITVNQKDVVFFYFLGFGYNNNTRQDGNKVDRFPSFYLRAKNKQLTKLKQVAMNFKKSNPRLVICVADCSNDWLNKKEDVEMNFLDNPKTRSFEPAQVWVKKLEKLSQTELKKQWKQMFLQTEGVVLMSSTKATQSAWMTERNGSLFTYRFENLLRKSPHNWKSLLQNSMISTSKDSKKQQVPQYCCTLKQN